MTAASLCLLGGAVAGTFGSAVMEALAERGPDPRPVARTAGALFSAAGMACAGLLIERWSGAPMFPALWAFATLVFELHKANRRASR